MANNRVQVKRTSTTGRTPNTTGSYATNSQYISAGELALNMTDGILYTSDGTNLIEIGANNTNQRITNSLTVNNDKNLRFVTVNTSAAVSFVQQSDDNFVMYSTNTAYGQRAIWSVYANSITSNLQIQVPLQLNAGLVANGGLGSAGQVLTSNGTTTYWSTVSGGAGSVNTAAQYTWTNLHTFSANVAFTGNGIGLTTNTAAIYLGGLADNNWKIGRNTGSTTKWRYTNNSIDVITANSNLEGFAIGLISGNSYFETGYLGTFIAANVTIGNSSSNSTINSTAFSGSANNTTYVNGKTEGNLNVNNALTSNNSSFLGGTAAASYQLNSTLNANIASYLPTYTGVVNGSSHTVGTSFTANSTVVNAVSYYAGTTLIGNTTGPYGKTEGNLNVNNATTAYGKTEGNLNVNSALTSNNSTNLGGTAAASYQLNSTLNANIASYLPTYTGVVNGSSHTVGTSFTANSTVTNTVSLVVSTNTATIGTGTYFVANGNVGIGVSSPGNKLSIGSTASTGTSTPDTMDLGGTFRNTAGGAPKLRVWTDGTNHFGIGISSGQMEFTTTQASASQVWYTEGTEKMRLAANGNVGIGTASPVYKLEVSGSFAATTKSFVIDHPSKKGMKLRHGSLEGPENGVYVRGRTNTNIIELPDYWVKLIDKDSITVSLTAIGKTVCPSVGKITNKKINLIGDNIDCFFHVFAERKDVEKLVVEY